VIVNCNRVIGNLVSAQRIVHHLHAEYKKEGTAETAAKSYGAKILPASD
jgi:hypothetical protein